MADTTKGNTPACLIEALSTGQKIGENEQTALKMEEKKLESLLDLLPTENGPADEYRRLLFELTDTYQQIARQYKKLAGV